MKFVALLPQCSARLLSSLSFVNKLICYVKIECCCADIDITAKDLIKMNNQDKLRI